jgi:hypothetical protein
VKEKRKQGSNNTDRGDGVTSPCNILNLFEKEAQLWMKLEEDQQVQQWDQEEERISTTIQDLKQRQR